jgi:hypothetical protein
MNQLLQAINFVMPACKESVLLRTQHLLLQAQMIVASDGVLMIGHPIEEDLQAAPLGKKLLSAMVNAKDTYSITQLDTGKLTVKSGRTKLTVPCLPVDDMPTPWPDVLQAPIDDTIKAGFSAVLPLAQSDASHVALASVQLSCGVLRATNRMVAIEYWHGHNLPENILVPREAAAAVVKSPYPLMGFGYGGTSCTFWFDNDSYIKTQLYNDTYPDIAKVLDAASKLNNYIEIEKEFFDDIKMLSDFADDERIRFEDDFIYAKSDKGEISSVECDGMIDGHPVDVKAFNVVKSVMKQATFESNAIYFMGDNLRGAIARKADV